MVKFMKIVMPFILLFFVTASWATAVDVNSADGINELSAKYSTLKQQYKEEEQGKHLTHLDKLIADIENARKSRRYDDLNYLLNELKEALGDKQASDNIERVNYSKISEIEILEKLFKNDNFITLIRLKSSTVKIAENGAVGRNIDRFSDVAAQRDVLWSLYYGIATQDIIIIDNCVKALEYGFLFLADEGYFANGRNYSPLKALTADAFFMQAVGHIYHLLKDTPIGRPFLPRLQRLEPGIKKSLLWLQKNHQELLQQDGHAPNRLAFDGLAFLANGLLLNDSSMIETSLIFVEANLKSQRRDGVYLEYGGHDSSYQAVNLLILQFISLYIPNESEFQKICVSINKGMNWQKNRILQNGQIRVDGNTRTGLGQETFLGKVKEVNYPEVSLALFYWSILNNSTEYEALAEAVLNYAISKK